MNSNLKFDVGTNFDPELLNVIDAHNSDNKFDCVFGKLRMDMFGGGRPSNVLPDISFTELTNYIELTHLKNLKFNYLMNPYCLANQEVFPKEHRKILKFIDKLVEIGVDGMTVNSPLLCSVIKKRHPNIEITIGAYSSIYTIKQCVEWKELGADVLTVGHCLNRNFTKLSTMMEVAKKIDIKLRLIANNICLRDCVYKTFHGTELSHASQLGEKGSDFFVDYCTIQCTRNKIVNPEKLIASEWIRPEDVKYYEDLCHKTEFNGLSIKLLDRIKSTEFIARVVKAYSERSYKGNLLDIITIPGEGTIKQSKESNIARTVKYKFDPAEMAKMGKFFSLPHVLIDNTKLDGFLEKFFNGYSCDEKICVGNSDAVEGFSENCTYCKTWAAKAISFNKEEIVDWKLNADSLLESMKTSKMFTYTYKK